MMDFLFGGGDAIYAIGVLPAIGIGASVLGGLFGGKKKQPSSPAFEALSEIRRRRMQELQDIQGFTDRLVGQRMAEPMGEASPEQSAVERLRILLQRRGQTGG